ncbi:hypothetical protein EJB05_26128, partial [Eragrostis curvula]
MAAAAGNESHLRAALREAFGDSSNSESDAPAGLSTSCGQRRGRREAVEAMRFGDLPSWAVELSMLIREAIFVGDVSVGADVELMNEDEDSCPLPSDSAKSCEAKGPSTFSPSPPWPEARAPRTRLLLRRRHSGTNRAHGMPLDQTSGYWCGTQMSSERD